LEEPLVFAISTANYRKRKVYASKLEVIIFGSVRFLPLKNNQTGRQKKGTQTEPEPVQTDQLRFGLGLVF
jgi:hypothetical protein